jgi:hypothetical protein
MTSRSDKILDLTDTEELAEALRLARSAKNQLNDMSSQAKVLARVMVQHFETYEAEIARLNEHIPAALDAVARETRLTETLTMRANRILELEAEVTNLKNELKAIDRQRRQERNTW